MISYSQENIVGLFNLIGRISGQEVAVQNKYDFILTSNSAWPNLIFNPRFDPLELSETIENIKSDIGRGNCPCILMFDPNENSSDTISWLKNENYKNGTWVAMSMSLDRKIELEQTDLEIHQNKNLDACCHIVETTLMGQVGLDKTTFHNLSQDSNINFLLGTLNGRPICSALLYTQDNSAGIYLVGTLNEFRRCGYGKAITTKAINLAYEQGCSEIHIQATHEGKGMYESLGFKTLGIIDVFKLT